MSRPDAEVRAALMFFYRPWSVQVCAPEDPMPTVLALWDLSEVSRQARRAAIADGIDYDKLVFEAGQAIATYSPSQRTPLLSQKELEYLVNDGSGRLDPIRSPLAP